MQSAVAGSCYTHDEDFKTQLMKKAAALFKKVNKDQDKKISRKKHDNSSLTSYGVPFEKFDVNEDQYVSLEEYKNQMGESHNIGAKKV
tara:strand:- start:68 stop:331 length:264 start_codon:yes stop_codon:yes gene_type:complete